MLGDVIKGDMLAFSFFLEENKPCKFHLRWCKVEIFSAIWNMI